MSANDMKLLSAIIVALALCIPVAVEKLRIRKSYSEGGKVDMLKLMNVQKTFNKGTINEKKR